MQQNNKRDFAGERVFNYGFL